MSVLQLARPEIVALAPYSSARMEAQGGAIFLNANESPWPPPQDAGRGLNRYPEPQPDALLQRLARIYGVRSEQVLVGRGSDEAIDLLVRAFCRAGADAVLISPPTFGMYAVCARTQGATVTEVPLRDDCLLDIDAVLAAVTPALKLVFVCSPNNPSGGLVPLAEIERLARALDGRALLIVDEAYIEYAEAISATTLLRRHENLGVLRTLSKAWALAGARIGALLAAPEIIALLRRIMPPYPLPTPSVQAALAALQSEAQALMGTRVAATLRERARVAAALATMAGVRVVLPSRANFIAFRIDDAANHYTHLQANGVVLRDIGRYPHLAGYLRLSIGLPEENDRALALLARAEESA
ncbi:histidinol-phosphate aminotransferase [mine drainage metagenome]|uniref:Histidinol-phosphate aminotransferase n=1 Tax=mine drainage metagenome TaxID=410659 RepID=T1AQ97_9ZZZZ